jgi:hypothetical protein
MNKVLGYNVFTMDDPDIFPAQSWEEAISIAEFIRQVMEKKGIQTTLIENFNEEYCVEHGSGVYATYYDQSRFVQIVISTIYGSHSRL